MIINYLLIKNASLTCENYLEPLNKNFNFLSKLRKRGLLRINNMILEIENGDFKDKYKISKRLSRP